MREHRSRFVVALAVTASITAALAGCTAAGAPATPSQPPPPPGDTPPIAQAWTAAWNGTDPGELGNLFTPDGTYRDLGVGKTSIGPAGATAWKTSTTALIDQVHVTVANAFRDRENVVVQGTYAGHIRTAPRPFAVPIVTVLRMQGDRIADDADHYDVAEVLRQSGLPPTWTPPQQ